MFLQPQAQRTIYRFFNYSSVAYLSGKGKCKIKKAACPSALIVQKTFRLTSFIPQLIFSQEQSVTQMQSL